MSRNGFLAGVLLATAGWLTLAAPAAEPAAQPAANPASQPAALQAETSEPAAAPRGPAFHFRELTFDLGFEGAGDRRHVEYETNQWQGRRFRQTDTATRLEETIGMRTRGALFDEKLMQFDFAGRWGLDQEWYKQSGTLHDDEENPNGNLLQYDLTTTFLPRGKISGTATASRVDSRVPRAFLPSLDRTQEKYGADLYFNDRTFPMRFSFEHLWDELTSRTRDLNDDEQRGHDLLRYEGTWQIAADHALRLEYEHEERAEQYSGSKTRFDTTRDYAVITDTLRFGPDSRSSLETLGRFQNERGDLARDNAEVSSRLRLQHTDSLSSNFAAQYLQESLDELTTRTIRAEAGLTHQLGQTLTTTGQLYGLRQNADEGADFSEWGGLLSSAFSRDNALGRFSASASYNHTGTRTEDNARQGIVIGEAVTFRDPLPSFLAKMDVQRLSVIVTDATHSRTYLPGRDYFVLPLGRYTSLTRVPTGQIADGQSVLVSYTYGISRDFRIDRDRVDWRIQQDFLGGFTPYYAGSFQNEDMNNPQYVSFQARNVNRHRFGATFRQQRWSVGGEYEYNDDTIDPYQAVRFDGDAVVWQKAAHQLDAKATLSRFWFDGAEALDAHNTTLCDFGLTYRYALADSLEANASAMYRYENDSLQGVTHGVDVTTSVDWKIGRFALRFEADYDVLHLPGSDDDSLSVWIKLRREIPVIARTGR